MKTRTHVLKAQWNLLWDLKSTATAQVHKCFFTFRQIEKMKKKNKKEKEVLIFLATNKKKF